MWWRKAKPGDKIVCLDNRYDFGEKPTLCVGRVYTVGHIHPLRARAGLALIGPYKATRFIVHVLEVSNPLTDDGGFAVERFRPVDPASKKADRVLASLKPSLLNPIPIRKHETAGGE